MSLYGFVVGLILIFPWSLVLMILLGASSSALGRRRGFGTRPTQWTQPVLAFARRAVHCPFRARLAPRHTPIGR